MTPSYPKGRRSVPRSTVAGFGNLALLGTTTRQPLQAQRRP
jgi:hypothetical protein